MLEPILRQASCQCPSCGSWYRKGNNCNQCGMLVVDVEQAPRTFHLKSNRGRQWSKAKHGYLTAKEIKEGKRGG